MKTASERKAEERARRRAEGLRPLEVWAHPVDHAAVKRYVEHLVRKRQHPRVDRETEVRVPLPNRTWKRR